MIRVAAIVAAKELRDGARDRRSLLSAFVFPLLSPVLMLALFSLMGKQLDAADGTGEGPREADVLVVGGELAPALLVALDDADVRHEPFVGEDAEAAVRAGTAPLVLIVDADYAADYTALRPARVALLHDASKLEASRRLRRVSTAIDGYSRQLGAMRLLAQGVDPGVGYAVMVEGIDVSTPEQRGARLLELIPMFLIMATFICTMYLAIDVTAGERERGSLEALALVPVPPMALTLGKWAATVAFGLLGVAVTTVGSIVAVGQVDLSQFDVSIRLGAQQGLAFFGFAAPLVLLAGSVQLYGATFARSFKEAQTYLSVLMLAPMVPGMIFSVKPVDPEPYMFAIPALAQQLLMSRVLRGEAVTALEVGTSVLSCVGLAVVFLVGTARLLRSERVLLGR